MNWKLESGTDVNALMLVAHPDDETIFGAGVMLSNPNWRWTIICVTMQMDTNRPQEFQRAIAAFQKAGVNIESSLTLSKRDTGQNLSDEEQRDWKESVNQLGLSPHIVFTHNEMGEYGHNHHMYVSRIANELFPNVWNFAYPGGPSISPQPTKALINEVHLSEDLLGKKKEIFNEAYAVQAPGLWENLRDIMEYFLTKGPEVYTSEAQ